MWDKSIYQIGRDIYGLCDNCKMYVPLHTGFDIDPSQNGGDFFNTCKICKM